MEKFEGVANTLFIPLLARIYVSKKFPEYFYDAKALELEGALPEGVEKGSSQYSNLASVARYYNMDQTVISFIAKHKVCNIVYLGAGLETAYDRLNKNVQDKLVNWIEVDLPEVIEARHKVLGKRENELLIGCDMFQFEWANKINNSLPTLLVVSGVFQYFHENDVVDFIKKCKEMFAKGEIIFDATNKSGLKFTNWFIKRTGNKTALMYFYVNDGQVFARKCEATLVKESTFYPDALRILKNKLSLVTKISMMVAERKKQAIILQLRFN